MSHILAIIGAIIGAVYVLFLPGLVWSFVFFRRHQIDLIERLALSFALSIALVPLLAFYLNLVHVKISRTNIVLEVAGLIIVGAAIAWWRKRKSSDKLDNGGAVKQPSTGSGNKNYPLSKRSASKGSNVLDLKKRPKP